MLALPTYGRSIYCGKSSVMQSRSLYGNADNGTERSHQFHPEFRSGCPDINNSLDILAIVQTYHHTSYIYWLLKTNTIHISNKVQNSVFICLKNVVRLALLLALWQNKPSANIHLSVHPSPAFRHSKTHKD